MATERSLCRHATPQRPCMRTRSASCTSFRCVPRATRPECKGITCQAYRNISSMGSPLRRKQAKKERGLRPALSDPVFARPKAGYLLGDLGDDARADGAATFADPEGHAVRQRDRG